ncbi:cyclinH/Ccl1 related protein, partial [Kipferlia bialata]
SEQVSRITIPRLRPNPGRFKGSTQSSDWMFESARELCDVRLHVNREGIRHLSAALTQPQADTEERNQYVTSTGVTPFLRCVSISSTSVDHLTKQREPLTPAEEALVVQHSAMGLPDMVHRLASARAKEHPLAMREKDVYHTATVLLRRLYLNVSVMDLHPDLARPAILFLAIKAEEAMGSFAKHGIVNLRDIVKVNKTVLTDKSGRLPSEAKDLLGRIEVQALAALRFHLTTHHPYKLLRSIMARFIKNLSLDPVRSTLKRVFRGNITSNTAAGKKYLDLLEKGINRKAADFLNFALLSDALFLYTPRILAFAAFTEGLMTELAYAAREIKTPPPVRKDIYHLTVSLLSGSQETRDEQLSEIVQCTGHVCGVPSALPGMDMLPDWMKVHY